MRLICAITVRFQCCKRKKLYFSGLLLQGRDLVISLEMGGPWDLPRLPLKPLRPRPPPPPPQPLFMLLSLKRERLLLPVPSLAREVVLPAHVRDLGWEIGVISC